MKKLILCVVIAVLGAPLGFSGIDGGGIESDVISPAPMSPQSAGRGLGDVNWHLDVEAIPGVGYKSIGVEFDGGHFWLTTFGSFGEDNYLIEITPDGTLVNKYTQPTDESWKDMAWDGQYLYAGGTYGIVQIDPASGEPTGLTIGPIPGPLRALAYDPTNDTFWFASFTSSFYRCQKDGSYTAFPNPGLAVTGAAFEVSDPSTPMLWWWSQDGPTGALASEYDPEKLALTGKSFAGNTPLGGGIAGGACAYELDDGDWELVGFYQGAPDHIAGHDLAITTAPLASDDKYVVPPVLASEVDFFLSAGAGNANRSYGLFASASGTKPGTPLPGGLVTLPLNWDWFSELMAFLGLLGYPFTPFFGDLDEAGKAMLTMTVPQFEMDGYLPTHFAFCLSSPFDFASNPRPLIFAGRFAGPIMYDDGTSENALGWTSDGQFCWMHSCELTEPTVIYAVSTAFGGSVGGGGVAYGDPCTVYVWEDLNDDHDPVDAKLLASKEGVVAFPDTDVFNDYWFDEPARVDGVIFFGCAVYLKAGEYAAPLDQDLLPSNGQAWICGGDPWDPEDLSTGYRFELGTIGYSGSFLLRANDDYK
ncbi:MAG: hypothetical protein ACYTG7_22455 [Planctomycetota bacterium]|jgi:hypothetical protein